ncbi:MAG: hypothetical protein WBB27_04060, partial [Maribacter sp.]
RQTYVEAEATFSREIVVCNDSEEEKTFELSWNWQDKQPKTQTITLSPATTERVQLKEQAPLKTSKLMVRLAHQKEVVSADTLLLSPIGKPKIASTKTLQIYKDKKLAETLSDLGFSTIVSDAFPNVKDDVIWVVPERADNRELNRFKSEILNYLNLGGKVLCLKQSQAPLWFPVKLNYWPANQAALNTYGAMGWDGINKDLFYSTEAPIYAPRHPIFSGIPNTSLNRWNNFDGRVSDDVFTRPASIGNYESGNWRTLAGGTRRELISLAELFYGKGVLISCQLDVVSNLQNTQANRLFFNTIDYLSDYKSEPLSQKIKTLGSPNHIELAELLGVPMQAFEKASPEHNDLLLAFEDASSTEVKKWAMEGGRALVLSKKLSETFDGFKTKTEPDQNYVATKVAEHPLLAGVSSANFMSDQDNPIQGFFKTYPDSVSVLLQGFVSESDFWKINEAGPVMLKFPYGKGEIILSTLEITENPSNATKELLSLFLTNNGTAISIRKKPIVATVTIKETVPLKIDGNLNEWLEDMEDRLVTPYIHAQPVYLTSESIIEGPPVFDLNLSGITYFLWNEKGLHIAGTIFMDKKLFGGESYNGTKDYTERIRLNSDIIELTLENNKAKVRVNEKYYDTVSLATNQMNSNDMTDASMLQFKFVHASGRIASVDAVEGETFEMTVPWKLLKSKPKNNSIKALISLESKGSKIQVPFEGDPEKIESWLQMNLQKTNKK